MASFKAHWGPSTHMAPRRFWSNQSLFDLSHEEHLSRKTVLITMTQHSPKYSLYIQIFQQIQASCLNKKQELSLSVFFYHLHPKNSGNQPTSQLCSPMRFFLDPPQWPQVWSNRYACGSCHWIRALRALAGGVPSLGRISSNR